MLLLRFMDYFGLLPKAIHRDSPFHASAFVTDLESLEIGTIYHHIYNSGTTSFFLAFGSKERELFMDPGGTVRSRKCIPVKVVKDERICDGHYYAAAFKYMHTLFQHPESLETPPADTILYQ